MKKLLLLDLDSTLFMTFVFWNDVCAAIARTAGIADERHYVDDYEAFVVGDDKLRYIDYEQLLRDAGTDDVAVRAELAKIAVGKSYLYEDALHLLEQLPAYRNDYDIAVLTFGQALFQQLKLDFSPELAALPHYITSVRKNQFIVSMFGQYEAGMLVDDKAGQELPDGWHELYLNRQMDSAKSPLLVNQAIHEIFSLADVSQFLKS